MTAGSLNRCRRPHCGGTILTFDDGQDVTRRCLLCARGDDWKKVIAFRRSEIAGVQGGSLTARLLSPSPPSPTMIAVDEPLRDGRRWGWRVTMREESYSKVATLPASTGRTWTKRLDGDWNGVVDNIAAVAEELRA